MKYLIKFVIGSFLLVLVNANAADMYFFKDKEGNTLMTNSVGADKKPTGEYSQYDSLSSTMHFPDCKPDASIWYPSSVSGIYISQKATLLKQRQNSFIQLWINHAKLSESGECSFTKQYTTVACVSSSSGENWYNLTPADPDSDLYKVIQNICIAFPTTKKHRTNSK